MRIWLLRHPIFATFMTTYLLGTLMQGVPGLASDRSESYLVNNDYPDVLTTTFNTDRMQVYDRYNPLSSLHAVGRSNLIATMTKADEDFFDKALRIFNVPVESVWGTIREALSYIPPYYAVDAYAINMGETCYIRPPGDISIPAFITTMSDTDLLDSSAKLRPELDEAELSHALTTYAMAHEMQHCEQGSEVNVGTNLVESDADLAALQIVRNADYSQDTTNLVGKIVLATRTLSSLNGDGTHSTALNLENGHASPAQSHLSDAAYDVVTNMVQTSKDHIMFPEEMSPTEKNYHIIRAVTETDLLADFRQALAFAQQYIEAVHYIDSLTEDSTELSQSEIYRQIDMGFLHTTYPHDYNKRNGAGANGPKSANTIAPDV